MLRPKKVFSDDSLNHDFRAYTIYFLIAILCMLLWWRGQYPFPHLGGDSSDIASFAAAWLHPDKFVTDPTLGRVEIFGTYATIHIPLLIGLNYIFADFGTSVMILLVPALFTQAIGFHLLGLYLFGSRFPAILLALLSFGTVSLTLDYYGTYIEPQPRLLFLSLFPYVLLYLFRNADRPSMWVVAFAALGLLMYVHPVSTPTVALACWMAMWALHPKDMPISSRLRWMLTAGFTFLLVVAPFMVIYLSTRAYGTVENYQLFAKIHLQFGLEFNDYKRYLADVLTRWETRILLPAWGVLGFLAVYILAPKARQYCAFFIIWTLTIIAGSVGITAIEQFISQITQTRPVEIDLIRNIRYVCLPLILFGVWGSWLSATTALPGQKGVIAAAMICLVWLGFNRPGSIPFRATLNCISQGGFFCKPQKWIQDKAALDFIKNLPNGARVLPIIDYTRRPFSLAIRYYAMKPLAWTYQDGVSALGYSDFNALERWWTVYRQLQKAKSITDHRARSKTLFKIAENLKTDVIASEIILDNKSFSKNWILMPPIGGYYIAVRCSIKEEICAG